MKAHYGCVNAIEFANNGGEWIVSGGDDRRVLLWNTEKALSGIGNPISMKGEHNSNIFCLAFDNENKKIFSGGNDELVQVHDIESGTMLDVFLHEDAVYGLSVDPNNNNVFASACDDGRILIIDIREPATRDYFCLAEYASSMHAVMYNPVEPRLLATANAKEGVGLWDVRKPRTALLRFGGSGYNVQQSCMSVRINSLGDKIIALRRRLPPVLYEFNNPNPVCEFDQPGYYNSCTMKSCCFAGDQDQYILSGSDDFNLYMWRIPDDLSKCVYVNRAHMVLRDHRSIVNQVRFNPSNHLVISSGVEKVVKIWSPFPIPNSRGSLRKSHKVTQHERPVYTHEEYINLVLRSGHIMSHDYTHQSTEEDPRMMAFFDSLVQRELEGWSSDEEYSTNDDDFYERMAQAQAELLEISPQPSSDDDEGSFSPFTIAFASVMTAREADNSQNRIRTVRNTLLQNSSTTPTTITIPTALTTTPSTTTANNNTTSVAVTSSGNSTSSSLTIFSGNSASAAVSTSSSPSSTLMAIPLDANITLQGPQWSPASGRERMVMEGQQPNNNRKSISQLIAQKRKENASMLVSDGGHVANIKKRIYPWNPSSSDSDEDVSYSPRVRVKLKKMANPASTSQSTSSASTAAVFSSASSLFSRTATANSSETWTSRVSSDSTQKQKALSDLRKWKELRCQINSTDYRVGEKKLTPQTVSSSSPSSSSSSLLPFSSSSISSSLFGLQTGITAAESRPTRSSIKVPSVSAQEGRTVHKDEPELGPYLHKRDPLLLPLNLGEATNSAENGCNFLTKVSTSTSGQNSNRENGNPVSGHASQAFSAELMGSRSRNESNNNNNLTRSESTATSTGLSNSNVTSNAVVTATSSSVNSSSSEPVWTEFKRFKHRLERARCHYRQQSQSEQQSSDEDTT